MRDPLLSKRPHKNLFSLLSAKARKSITSARGGGRVHINAMMYMAPHTFAGVGNVCTSALHCIQDCLWRSGQVLMGYNAGRTHEAIVRLAQEVGKKRGLLIKGLIASGVSKTSATSSVDGFIKRGGEPPRRSIEAARIAKTRRWFNDREEFLEDVYYSIRTVLNSVKAWGGRKPKWLKKMWEEAGGGPLTPVVRLNGTSDLAWERVTFQGKTFFDRFPGTQFYDYTKHAARALAFAADKLPRNYHLTFSMGGVSDERIPEILASGCNVTMVFNGYPPKKMSGPMQVTDAHGRKKVIVLPPTEVIYGDEDDLRFLDPRGVIVGLKYKRAEGETRDPNFVLEVPGDIERWTKEEVEEKSELLHRENPDEADLLGDGPTATFVPGSAPPIELDASQPVARAVGDHTAVTRLGCGGYGTKPLYQA